MITTLNVPLLSVIDKVRQPHHSSLTHPYTLARDTSLHPSSLTRLLSVIDQLDPLRGLEATALSFINRTCSDPSKETVVIRRNIQDIVYGLLGWF